MRVPVKVFFTEELKAICKEKGVDYKPKYQTEGSACCDARSSLHEKVLIHPNETILIPLGIHMEIPTGWQVNIYSRSGLACKMQLITTNSVAVIDNDYRGNVQMSITNVGSIDRIIEPAERICQLAINPVYHIQWEEVDDLDELSETERGHGGFGHTGNIK